MAIYDGFVEFTTANNKTKFNYKLNFSSWNRKIACLVIIRAGTRLRASGDE
jgi:hypothetical protein